MAQPILEMRSITKRFPGVVANDDVWLDVLPGEIHVLLGENGAGKTNLLEAAYLALTGLTGVTRLEQLIQSGEREAYVRADVQQGGSLSIQEVGLGRGRG